MNRDLAKQPQQTQAIAVIQREGLSPITITFQEVKTLICPDATDAEIKLFLKVCESEQLNPFIGEIYLVKFGSEKAAIIKSIDVYIQHSEKNAMFNGIEDGLILKTKSLSTGQPELVYREGAIMLDEEELNLVGGWAKVYRKDREKPFFVAVRLEEYLKYTRDGNITKMWQKPAMMINKVAKKQALKKAFPTKSGEIPTEDESSESLDSPFMKNGNPNWLAFWNKTTELGFTDEEVHKILHVESMKDFVNQGNSLEDAVDFLVNYQKRGLKYKEVRQSIIAEWTGESSEKAPEALPPGQGELPPDNKAFEDMKSQTEGKQTKYPDGWKPKDAGQLLQYALDEKGLSKGMVLADVLCIGNIKDINLDKDFEKVKAAKKFEVVK